MPVLDQRQIGGSAADVHVQDGFACPGRKIHCPRPLGGKDTLQIRPCRCHHKIPRVGGQCLQYRACILLAGGFPRDDDGTGIHILFINARGGIFPVHDPLQRLRVHQFPMKQGRKMDRAFIEDFPIADLQFRHREAACLVLNAQP